MGRWEEIEPCIIKNPKEYLASRPRALRYMTEKEMKRYDDKVVATQGFYVDDCPGFMPGKIVSIRKGTREWFVAEQAAGFSAVDYRPKMKRPPMQKVTLTKANHQAVGGLMYYVTFKGVDSDGIQAEYQAKVWLKPGPDLETCYIDKIPNTEIDVSGKKRRKSHPNSRLGCCAFLKYVRSLREEHPTLTFAQAKRKGSHFWRLHLTDAEKRKFLRAAAKDQKQQQGGDSEEDI